MLKVIPSILAAALVVGCNHTPVSNLEKSFTLKVEAGTGSDDPVKIDFLWVVDNSTSMCQEQSSLSNSFDIFTSSLERFFKVDARIAVTSVDAQCENNGTNVFAAKGKFNQHVTRTYPVACGESTKRECGFSGNCDGLDCSYLDKCDSNGEWSCQDIPTIEECVFNLNGTVNTYCRRGCDTDAECQSLFGDTLYKCLKPSGSSGEESACVRQPPTQDCPDELPPFLEKNPATNTDNTNLFKCAATVGVHTGGSCLRYEQPMKTAYMALDPTDINREQALAFLRPDAYLVVIIVSDEEDCSVAPGREGMVGEQEYNRCGLLDTTDTNGPLTPVAHFINKFKALKDDPGKVIMATIAGDSTATDPAQREAEREAYTDSKGGARTCYEKTYICNTRFGVADYGARYRELSEGFGPNGSFQNICNPEGVGPALEAIARTIVAVINKVCLPKPILTGLKVTRIRGGVETELTEGEGPGTYNPILGAEDCAVDGELLPAITFGDAPEPGDQIKVVYQGDPQLP